MFKVFYKKLSRRQALQIIVAASSMGIATSLDREIVSFAKHALSSKDRLSPWERILEKNIEYKNTLAAFCNLLIPKDQFGPSAGEIGIPDFIDEWISAPFDQQKKDLKLAQVGLFELNKIAHLKFSKNFATLLPLESELFMKKLSKEDLEYKKATAFFKRFRILTGFGYYTNTDYGWKALGYVGNEYLKSFDGPQGEVKQKLIQRLGISNLTYTKYLNEWKGLS